MSPLLALLLAAPAFAQEPDHVQMNLDEFLQLYDQSRTPPETPAVPPYEHALTRLVLQGELQKDGNRVNAVSFRGRGRVEVLAEHQWVAVPVLPVSVALRSVKAQGRELAVTQDGQWYHVLLDRRQALDLELDFVVPVTEDQGTSSLSVDLPPWASTELSLRVPGEERLDVQVGGAAALRHRDDTHAVEASIPPGQGLWITWQRALPTQEAGKPRVQAEVLTLSTLGDGLQAADVTVSYAIAQAPVDHLELRCPSGFAVVDVGGAGLRRWALGPDSILRADLNFRAEGAYTLTLRLEAPAAGDGSVRALPLVEPLNVERRKGWAGVVARGALELRPAEVQGAVPVAARALPPTLRGATDQPILFGWKYLGDVGISVTASSHRDVAVLTTLLDEARATTMVTREGRRLTSVRYLVRNHGRQFLRAKLPAGATLWSAQVGGAAVQPGAATDGALLLPLLRSQEEGGALAAFSVELVYVEEGATRDRRGRLHVDAALPEADVPITWVGWTLWMPEGARVPRRSARGSLRQVDALSTPWDPAELQAIQTVSQTASANVRYEAHSDGSLSPLQDGSVPVDVRIPTRGTAVNWEGLLAFGDSLRVSFDARGVR